MELQLRLCTKDVWAALLGSALVGMVVGLAMGQAYAADGFEGADHRGERTQAQPEPTAGTAVLPRGDAVTPLFIVEVSVTPPGDPAEVPRGMNPPGGAMH